jgi:hypothetical protein
MTMPGSPPTAHRRLDLKPGVVRRVIPWRDEPEPGPVQQHRDSLPAASDPIELCRQARKLRATYAHKPAEMHRRLSRLTLEDRKTSPDASVNEDSFDCSGERAYRRLVERTIREDASVILRFSQRLELLKEATRRGIGRFQANLIIASVEHALRTERAHSAPIKSRSILSAWVLFATLQSVIVTGLWRLVR